MKKLILSLITVICLAASSFAVPGFTPYVPNCNGDFVYYKDSSFTRETYIGILCYDEGTYQLRYYAPKNEEQLLPPKEIALLVSIDKTSDRVVFTGERIISTVMPETSDVDIVNYLHDIFYDFAARRAKVENVKGFGERAVKTQQNYPQYGGNVTIVFDSVIPLFNIKKIIDSTGTEVLTCATFGRITSSEDKTFEKFTGFSKTLQTDGKKKTLVTEKAKSQKAVYDKQVLTIDTNWKQAMENCWVLDVNSFITLSVIPCMEDNLGHENDAYLLRSMLASNSETYNNLLEIDFSEDQKNGKYKINVENYSAKNGHIIRNTQILTRGAVPSEVKGFERTDKHLFYYFSMATFKDAYEANPAYFNKIVKSYKINH